jgi:hypothetical protein
MSELQELPPLVVNYYRLFKTLPPPKPPPESTLLDISVRHPCASCGTVTELVDFYNTGVLASVMVPLCSKCISSYKETAKIVCCDCKIVIGWLDPHTDKDKFVFEKNGSYHIRNCPGCVPALEKADIIEKIIYLNKLYTKRHE